MLAVVGTVLALTGIAIALVPPPSSQAAQGQKWLTGVPYAGYLTTNTGRCSVTVISEWLAITASHCGRVNPNLKLDVSATSTPGVVGIKDIEVNRDLDVEALILQRRTGLTVTPIRSSIDRDWFYTWSYGFDWSNNLTNHLTRGDFNLPQVCPDDTTEIRQGALCWETTAKNSVCTGDSGGPVTQNGAIIAMLTAGLNTGKKPNGSADCSTVYLGQAITVQEMRPWLNQMIKDADPFD